MAGAPYRVTKVRTVLLIVTYEITMAKDVMDIASYMPRLLRNAPPYSVFKVYDSEDRVVKAYMVDDRGRVSIMSYNYG